MENIRNGNHEAYRQLFYACYPRLLSYASGFVSDPDEAKDVVQGCFVRLWENRERLTVVSLQSLLFTMTRNACINTLKHKVVRGNFEASYLQENTEAERLYNFDFYGNADHRLLHDELQRKIDDVLATLPARTQEVFRMSRHEGLKNREIAEQLGISVKVVERHVGRALAAFRKAFGAAAPLIITMLFT